MEIDFTPKRLQIAKIRLQILIDNSESYSECTYFLYIEEKMTKLWCSKVGLYLNLKTLEEERPSSKEVELKKKSRIANNNELKFYM